MNLIDSPTIVSAAEASVIGMQQDAKSGLDGLKSAAVSAFRRLWGDSESRAAKLAVMGTNAVAAFEQHARTVQYLLASGVEMDPADYTPPVDYMAHNDGTITLE